MSTCSKTLGIRKLLNKHVRVIIRNSSNTLRQSQSSVEQPQTVFIEKILERPVLVVAEEDDVDIIGPPDALSNLRPVIRKRLINETKLQQQLREIQDSTQLWNQQFWADHNAKFIQERQEFIDRNQKIVNGEKQNLTADEMSEFYKSFLDKNWETHVRYNFEWYRRNFKLLVLAFVVSLEKNVIRFS